jgi:hypothetical protein
LSCALTKHNVSAPRVARLIFKMSEITPSIPAPLPNEPLLREHLYHAKDVASDPTLAATLTAFVNKGFMAQSTNPHAIKIWQDFSSGRFKSPNEINEMLGSDGILAVIYDDQTPIAVAGGVPWKQGSQELALEGEEGYEIKTVTVDPTVVKKGLATRCMGVVIKKLIEIERKKRDESGTIEDGKLMLFIQSAESVNGDYWRGRGYRDMRKYEMPAGFWTARTPFTMLVQAKEVDLE